MSNVPFLFFVALALPECTQSSLPKPPIVFPSHLIEKASNSNPGETNTVFSFQDSPFFNLPVTNLVATVETSVPSGGSSEALQPLGAISLFKDNASRFTPLAKPPAISADFGISFLVEYVSSIEKITDSDCEIQCKNADDCVVAMYCATAPAEDVAASICMPGTSGCKTIPIPLRTKGASGICHVFKKSTEDNLPVDKYWGKSCEKAIFNTSLTSDKSGANLDTSGIDGSFGSIGGTSGSGVVGGSVSGGLNIPLTNNNLVPGNIVNRPEPTTTQPPFDFHDCPPNTISLADKSEAFKKHWVVDNYCHVYDPEYWDTLNPSVFCRGSFYNNPDNDANKTVWTELTKEQRLNRKCGDACVDLVDTFKDKLSEYVTGLALMTCYYYHHLYENSHYYNMEYFLWYNQQYSLNVQYPYF